MAEVKICLLLCFDLCWTICSFLFIATGAQGGSESTNQPHLPSGVANGIASLHLQNGRGVASMQQKPTIGRGYSRGRGRSTAITAFPRQPQLPVGRGTTVIPPTSMSSRVTILYFCVEGWKYCILNAVLMKHYYANL